MKTKPRKKPMKPGYYRLPSGEIRKVRYDAGTTVYNETVLGERTDCPGKKFAKAVRIPFRPSIPELWKMSEGLMAKKESESGKWMNRLWWFSQKLIELGHIRIKTLGYYHSNSRYNRETIGESIAYALGSHWSHLFPATNEKCQALQDNFLAWVNNPSPNRARAAFPENRLLHVDRECPVTGWRFQWECNGFYVKPAKRLLEKHESEPIREKLLGIYKTLKEKDKATLTAKEQKQWDILQVLDRPMGAGWFALYDIVNLKGVPPFQQRWADPATKKLRKAQVEIDVPSGVLVFANVLHDHLGELTEEEKYDSRYDVGHQRGREGRTHLEAETRKAFYVSVGNSSPEIWQNKTEPSKLRIGRAAEEQPKNPKVWTADVATKEWKEKGRICTQVWCFHATDRHNLPKKIGCDHTLVRVPPGRYRLTNHKEHEGGVTGIFCEIERVPA